MQSHQKLKNLASRMLEAVPLLATTIFFISIFVYIFVYTFGTLELEEIKAHWNERRCEPLVMTLAALVQIDPKIDTTTFAVDNFEFCIGRIIDSSLSLFLSPMLAVFGQQIDATKPITDSMNYLREMAFSLMKPLMAIFGKLWDKFSLITFECARIFYKMYSAMDRIFGIATASVFAGMSMYKGIQNMMGFVIQVIIAILIILCILVVFLYFVMWPVIPVILTMIGILSTTVYAANVSGMSGSFCVAPSTLVKVKEGYKKVSELTAGEALHDGVIEGILKVEGSGECVRIHGVVLSKSHLVYHGRWIFAGDHPLAVPVPLEDTPSFLYCLNTSTRTWIVKDTSEELILRDWEELPDSHVIDFAWEKHIYTLLNGSAPTKPLRGGPGRGLFGEDTFVFDKKGNAVHIFSVSTGDYIKDKSGYTRVIGIYQDTSELVPFSGPNQSIWYYSKPKKIWKHPTIESCLPKRSYGFQLVTESGTFMVGYYRPGFKDIHTVLVRDFTEVGAKRIHETYPFTASFLN